MEKLEELYRFIKRMVSKINGKTRYVFLISIGFICIIAVCLGIYIEYFTEYHKKDPIVAIVNSGKEKTAEEYANLKSNFGNLFKNELVGEASNVKIQKSTSTKDIVYTGYDISNEDESFYDVKAKIPTINIDNAYIAEVNQNIRTEFYDKANSIMRQSEKHIIYNVSYAACIHNTILSVAIKTSLKEDSAPERIIIKTYNIDLENNEAISFENLIARKNLSKDYVQKQIKSDIKTVYNSSKALAEQYGGIYERNLKNPMYEVDNTENFLYTDNGDLYVIYSYGNNEETNEIDIVVF